MNKPRIRCYRAGGRIWWECCDENICAWAKTPWEAWENWFNRSIPF